MQEIRTGVYTLTVSAPVEFLTDPTTVYPVTIDPTITSKDTMTAANIEDATVFSGYPNNNFGNYVFNTIGYQDATYGTGRVAVRLKALLNDATYQGLSAADISSVLFYMKDGGSNYAYVNIHALTSNSTWTESTIKNSNLGTVSDTVYATGRMGGSAWTAFNLTTLVRDWKDGDQNGQCGFLMVIADSTKKIGALSCEYGSGDYWPYVVVEYTLDSPLSQTSLELRESRCAALSVETDEDIEITWTSSNSAVAAVTQQGYVCGAKAGTAVITASSPDLTEDLHCVVTVAIADGVYRISRGSMHMSVTDAQISSGTSVSLQPYATSGLDALAQQWKIKYIGNGFYSIRPMHKLNMGISVSNNSAQISSIGTYDTGAVIGANARWQIAYYTNGYAFINNSESEEGTMALMPYGNYGTAGTEIINATFAPQYYSMYTWSIAMDGYVDSQVLIYHAGEVADEVRKGVMPGQTRTLSDMDVEFAYVSPSNISQIADDWHSSDESVATVNDNTGAVTGVANGVVTITAKYIEGTEIYTASYTVVVSPLPISGYELDYEPEIWNYDPVQAGTNCYAYAFNVQIRPNTNTLWYMQPGDSVNTPILQGEITAQKVISLVTEDSEVLGFVFEAIEKTQICDPGCYKVALVIDNYRDYHWYRQNPDGTWSHKLADSEATNKDASEIIIYDPQKADRDHRHEGGPNYKDYVGFFQVTPLNLLYDSSATNTVTSPMSNMSTNNFCAASTAMQVAVGMTYQEVISMMGEPNRYLSSSRTIAQYDLDDKEKLTVYYAYDSERKQVYVAEILLKEITE